MQKGCPKCGRMIDSTYKVCPYCHYDFKEISTFFEKINTQKFIENEKYAGFIKRLVAGLLDIVFVTIFTYLLLILVDKYITKITIENLYIAIIIFIPLYILWNAIGERISWRGSLGKYIVGLQVVDEYENPVTFPKALIRNITKILNVVTLGIGFLLSAFPPSKQALNDKVSHTYVINKLVMSEETKLIYANPIKRLVAYIVDLLIISLLCYGILFLTEMVVSNEMPKQTVEMVNSAKYILCLVIILFYFPFGESHTGSTLGKNLMNIKVTKQNGEIAGFITSFVRHIIIVLDILSLGFLLTLVTPKRQTIKDILTKTVVINR